MADDVEHRLAFIVHVHTDMDDLRGAVEDVLALANAAEDHQTVWLGIIAVRDVIAARLGGA